MRSSARAGLSRFRIPALLLALIVVLPGLAAGLAAPAHAQEQAQRPWTLRDLFAPRKADRLEPVAPLPERQRKVKVRKKAAPAKKARTEQTARAPREPAATEKADDARVVLVLGDFLAGGLAEGLTAAYAEDPTIRVVSETNGSSGFVRDDFYDWPAEAGALIDAAKPAAVVVMLGANDRQQMVVGSEREAPRSEKWAQEYTRRTAALAKVIADRKIPFIWVGVPAFKPSKMLSDMLAFNDFYRAAAEGAGAEFVDIWDGFVDEDGGYVSSGPDLNGQPVRLRAEDGINLTMPGKRKVAFFAEKPLAKILGTAGAGGIAALTPALPSAIAEPVDIGSIKRTEPVSLADPALDGGTELLGLVVETKKEIRSPGERLAIEGIAPAALPGRADDFSPTQALPLPRPEPETPAGTDATSSIRP